MSISERQTRVRDVLAINDLSAAELHELIDLAELVKTDPNRFVGALMGETVVCFFQKPSTRTRVSLHGAVARLGATPLLLRPDELQLGRGEPVSDTARVLSSYSCAIAARVFSQDRLVEMAESSTVPVINALSDVHHPCQALADLLTIKQRVGSLAGVRLAYVGEGNNVAHSLMEAGALAGMHVAIASPDELGPDAGITANALRLADRHHGSIEVVSNPKSAVQGAHVVYTDVWVSMGGEKDADAHMELLRPYQVNQQLMAAARDDAIFMHCLPAHRGQEVTADVIDGPRSVVWEQAANRLPTEQALIYALVTGDWIGERA